MAEPNTSTDIPELAALRAQPKAFSVPAPKELTGLSTEMGAGVPGVPEDYAAARAKFKKPADVSAEQARMLQQQGKLEQDIGIAQQAVKQYEAESAASIATQQREAAQRVEANLDAVRAKLPYKEFHPTKDNIQSLSTLFGLIGVIGASLGGAGKMSATTSLNAMGGMMKGWQQGRADLWKKEKDEFDKGMQQVKAILDDAYKDADRAMKTLAYNRQEAEALANQSAAKLGGQVGKQILAKQGVERYFLFLDGVKKDLTHAEDMAFKREEARRREEAAERRHKEDLASREKIASMRSVGSKSANSERFAGNVYRSANEVLRSLELIEQIGINTGGGALGQVVGKGSIPSEVQRYIGQSFTEEQERNYNTAMSGVALEMAFVLNGGYKPDVAIQQKLENYLSVGPNDTRGTAAYKFADTVAKLKAAIETTPSFNETQKETKENLLKKFENYATPEVVYTRAYGIQPRTEPILQNQQNYPRPQTKADFDALPPDAMYIDPDDNKLYRKPRKQIWDDFLVNQQSKLRLKLKLLPHVLVESWLMNHRPQKKSQAKKL